MAGENPKIITMGKLANSQQPIHKKSRPQSRFVKVTCLSLILIASLGYYRTRSWHPKNDDIPASNRDPNSIYYMSPYGHFPAPDDPFHFIPCTSTSIPPALNDPHPENSWGNLFDTNPSHWNWGKSELNNTIEEDTYAGRGIFLCGYIDVPLDYTNSSDPRIARLAVTKFQVSGLAPIGSCSSAGKKSERTIVIEPGGPGGSGTSFAWRAAEAVTERLSEGQFDVLGWDPRGVNISLPAISCFPYDADRDRWSLLWGQAREVSPSPRAQLEFVDAFLEATFRACWERQGDLSRFVSTAFVARDLEEIRKALGEDELTGYLVSYGTGIGQTYANMFPDSVGRMILDGTQYVRDQRLVGGFGWTALDNGTDAWRDGFLGECLNAGPDHCALARARHGEKPTVARLEDRLGSLLKGLIERPIPGYYESSGPSLVTYTRLVDALYGAM
jgi:pimeloyl-ACP methyl ester carboxylesterase